MGTVEIFNYIALAILAWIAILGLIVKKKRKIDAGTPQEREVLSPGGWTTLIFLIISLCVGFVTEYFKVEASAEKSLQNRQLRENVTDLKRRLDEQFQLNQFALMNQTAPFARAVIILRTVRPTNSTARDRAAEYATYKAHTDTPVAQAHFVSGDTRQLLFMNDETGGSSLLGGIEFRLGDLWNTNIRVRPSGASSARGHLDTVSESEAIARLTHTITHEGDAIRIELSVDGTLPGSLLYSAARKHHPAVTLYRPTSVIAAADKLSRHWRNQITAVELFIALDPQAELWFSIPVRLGKDDASAAQPRPAITWSIKGDPTLFVGNP